MARYIKANPLVAKYLNLENDRNAVKDGNYILWQGDMLAFGPLTRLRETLAAIGAIALMPHEAREEQDGTVTRTLPEATDPRFVIATPVAEETTTEAPGNNADGEDEEAPTDEPNDNPEEPAEDAEPEAVADAEAEGEEIETKTTKASKK